MKKITFKSLSVLLAAALLVAALPLVAFAEDASVASSCQHIFEVTEYVTYESYSNVYHLKTSYSSNTCISCGYQVVVEEAPYLESHTMYKSYVETYTYNSQTQCLVTEYEIETCIWCESENVFEVGTYGQPHNIEESYRTEYTSCTNEYHITTEYLDEYCINCGELIGSYEESQSHGWHEFDDSVDEEVDMEGVCILCGDEVSW